MDIRPIRTDDDHRKALKEIERLWDFPDGSPENDKLDVLATLLGAYEDKRWPIESSTPLGILQYAVGDMGHTQAELAAVLGSRSLASESLTGRRRISVGSAQKISTAWKIPIQLLISSEPEPQQEQPRGSVVGRKRRSRAAA